MLTESKTDDIPLSLRTKAREACKKYPDRIYQEIMKGNNFDLWDFEVVITITGIYNKTSLKLIEGETDGNNQNTEQLRSEK